MDNFNTIYWMDTLLKIRIFLWILVFASGCFLLLVLFVEVVGGPSDKLKNLTIISSISFLYSVWGVVMIPGEEVLNKLFESGNSMVVKQLLLYIHKGTSVITYILFTIYFILKILQTIRNTNDEKHIINKQEEDEFE